MQASGLELLKGCLREEQGFVLKVCYRREVRGEIEINVINLRKNVL